MQEKITAHQQKRNNFSGKKFSSEQTKKPQKQHEAKNHTEFAGNLPPKPYTKRPDTKADYKEYLPLCPEDMQIKGWKELDVLLISGDAYIDHPAFATALLGRYLEYHGFKVGIITQPDWKNPAIVEQIQAMGRPRQMRSTSQPRCHGVHFSYQAGFSQFAGYCRRN